MKRKTGNRQKAATTERNLHTVNICICCSVSLLCLTKSLLRRAYSSWSAIKSYSRVHSGTTLQYMVLNLTMFNFDNCILSVPLFEMSQSNEHAVKCQPLLYRQDLKNVNCAASRARAAGNIRSCHFEEQWTSLTVVKASTRLRSCSTSEARCSLTMLSALHRTSVYRIHFLTNTGRNNTAIDISLKKQSSAAYAQKWNAVSHRLISFQLGQEKCHFIITNSIC